jgi:hypothetical protein
MQVAQAKQMLFSLCVIGLLVLPAIAEAQSVSFATTARHAKFL